MIHLWIIEESVLKEKSMPGVLNALLKQGLDVYVWTSKKSQERYWLAANKTKDWNLKDFPDCVKFRGDNDFRSDYELFSDWLKGLSERDKERLSFVIALNDSPLDRAVRDFFPSRRLVVMGNFPSRRLVVMGKPELVEKEGTDCGTCQERGECKYCSKAVETDRCTHCGAVLAEKGE